MHLGTIANQVCFFINLNRHHIVTAIYLGTDMNFNITLDLIILIHFLSDTKTMTSIYSVYIFFISMTIQ